MNQVLIADKSYKKEDPSTRKNLSKAICKLQERINAYNSPISQVFGDDILVHDLIHGHSCDFYVYKTVENGLQIRLLYTVVYPIDGIKTISIISHFIKKKNDKSYLLYFQKIADGIKC